MRARIQSTRQKLRQVAITVGSVALLASSSLYAQPGNSGGSNGQPFSAVQDQIDSLQQQLDALVLDNAVPLEMDVDCGAGDTITDAIAMFNGSASLTLNISGACNEAVIIERSNVHLRGVGDSASISGVASAVRAGRGASGIVIENLRLSSPVMALGCIDNAQVYGINLELVDSARGVVALEGGMCRIDDSLIANNSQGATVLRNGVVTIRGSDLLSNGTGANVLTGGSLTLAGSGSSVVNPGTGQTRVSGSAGNGLSAFGGGTLSLENVDIANNGLAGVSIRTGSTLYFEAGTPVIRDNGGPGLILSDLSTVSVSTTGTLITGNDAGVVCNGTVAAGSLSLVTVQDNTNLDIQGSCL